MSVAIAPEWMEWIRNVAAATLGAIAAMLGRLFGKKE